jgi:hypothetical protein
MQKFIYHLFIFQTWTTFKIRASRSSFKLIPQNQHQGFDIAQLVDFKYIAWKRNLNWNKQSPKRLHHQLPYPCPSVNIQPNTQFFCLFCRKFFCYLLDRLIHNTHPISNENSHIFFCQWFWCLFFSLCPFSRSVYLLLKSFKRDVMVGNRVLRP